VTDRDKWITVAEAAEQSGYSVSTIHWLIKQGRIKRWRPGHEWFTTLASVMEHKQKAKRGRPPLQDNADREST
jgi:excisionase family DNA binding protein